MGIRGCADDSIEKASCKGTTLTNVFQCRLALVVLCGQQSVQVPSCRAHGTSFLVLCTASHQGPPCPAMIVLITQLIVSTAVSDDYCSSCMASSLLSGYLLWARCFLIMISFCLIYLYLKVLHWLWLPLWVVRKAAWHFLRDLGLLMTLFQHRLLRWLIWC